MSSVVAVEIAEEPSRAGSTSSSPAARADDEAIGAGATTGPFETRDRAVELTWWVSSSGSDARGATTRRSSGAVGRPTRDSGPTTRIESPCRVAGQWSATGWEDNGAGPEPRNSLSARRQASWEPGRGGSTSAPFDSPWLEQGQRCTRGGRSTLVWQPWTRP